MITWLWHRISTRRCITVNVKVSATFRSVVTAFRLQRLLLLRQLKVHQASVHRCLARLRGVRLSWKQKWYQSTFWSDSQFLFTWILWLSKNNKTFKSKISKMIFSVAIMSFNILTFWNRFVDNSDGVDDGLRAEIAVDHVDVVVKFFASQNYPETRSRFAQSVGLSENYRF